LLSLQPLNIPEVAAGANQEPKTGALSGQRASHMAADESRRSGDKSQHLEVSS
jgi:hypothetical protein